MQLVKALQKMLKSKSKKRFKSVAFTNKTEKLVLREKFTIGY